MARDQITGPSQPFRLHRRHAAKLLRLEQSLLSMSPHHPSIEARRWPACRSSTSSLSRLAAEKVEDIGWSTQSIEFYRLSTFRPFLPYADPSGHVIDFFRSLWASPPRLNLSSCYWVEPITLLSELLKIITKHF